MNVTADKLTAWNRFAELARNSAIAARLAYAKGDQGKGRAMLMEMEQAAAAASVSLDAAGADPSQGLTGFPGSAAGAAGNTD